jgi:hypothetical protein
MWSKNIGNHQLGSRAYPKKQPWDKVDEVLRYEGKENPFDWFTYPEVKNLIRAQYYEGKETRDLVTTPKVKEVEKVLVMNLQAYIVCNQVKYILVVIFHNGSRSFCMKQKKRPQQLDKAPHLRHP